ncbi:MAG: F0F1 ATP synthase subunit B' [Proteobacteria bacterium]|nr:F0F1 ATP synthase subunit B' [Pseudomonadota bacterium]MCH8213334.1 F0F1 ATP synthase subunit B' [Pseudomonadota bacterium]
MPQLDTSTYAPQVIWLAITFGVLYVLMTRVALPRISHVLEERRHKIDQNLEKAESLKGDAEAAAAAYEGAMADARARAGDVLGDVREGAARDAAERQAELGARLHADIQEAEAGIAEARDKAVAGIRDLAAEVAHSAAEKLAGETVDAGAVRSAVDAALKERG